MKTFNANLVIVSMIGGIQHLLLKDVVYSDPKDPTITYEQLLQFTSSVKFKKKNRLFENFYLKLSKEFGTKIAKECRENFKSNRKVTWMI